MLDISMSITFTLAWVFQSCDYSCFEKGCPTKPYATIPKGVMGNGGFWSLVEILGVSGT